MLMNTLPPPTLQQFFDSYTAPVEVFEGRNWITVRLAMARAFHMLDLIEDSCSFQDDESADKLRFRLREMFELGCKADLLINEALVIVAPHLIDSTGSETAYENIKSCLQEIRERGNLTGRESAANLHLRLQWVLSLVSHLKYHLAGVDQ